MTADGSVVAITFGGPSDSFAYFRNSHGWFLVASALGAQGIDVKAQGWTELGLFGMSSDGTLLFGQGVHNNQVEGWVAEFPAGYLATFNPQPVPPSNTSIVGAWRVNDTESGSPAVVVFMADGTYYLINPTVTPDRDQCRSRVRARPLHVGRNHRRVHGDDAQQHERRRGTLGQQRGAQRHGLRVGRHVQPRRLDGDDDSARGSPRPRARRSSDTIVGAWVIGNPAAADSSFVVVFDADGTTTRRRTGRMMAAVVTTASRRARIAGILSPTSSPLPSRSIPSLRCQSTRTATGACPTRPATPLSSRPLTA